MARVRSGWHANATRGASLTNHIPLDSLITRPLDTLITDLDLEPKL
jgi:hypothetical protein